MLKFLKVKDEFKPYTACSDGTKCCFLFSNYDKVNEFMEELSKRINAEVTKDSYIGYKTIYVPLEKYKEAVIEGLNIILNDKSYEYAGVNWVDCYNERSNCYYQRFLLMRVNKNRLDERGFLTKLTRKRINFWKKRLENLLKTKVEVVEEFNYVSFSVKRTTVPEHEEILNKIHKSELFKKSRLFEAYALIDYYGEYIEK